jgi:membrane protein
VPAALDRLKARLVEVRRRRPAVDHAVRTVQHYGAVRAGQQAGAATYFGFLSFFPVLALGVFVVGLLAGVYPAAHSDLESAVDQLFPGLVGPGEGQVDLDEVQRFSGWAGVVGLAGVLYAGLGWFSALRAALEVVFQIPPTAHPGFVAGKVRDLVALVVVGLVLFTSVAAVGFVTAFSTTVLGWLALGEEVDWLLVALSRLLGLAANVLLFYAVFRLVGRPPTPRRALWQGAVLGAIGFEVLKAVSFLLLAQVQGSPAFQAFGIALILLVWIHYFSQVVLYAAAYAHTSREARLARAGEPTAPPAQGPPTPPLDVLKRMG